ncbi:DUF7793 family protein [Winogradskyella endarachnes]|uniref:STAS domain-containing protein n=1 Tax=Winogradskyella endarachnes TaxID=2681965 RepID=A0A6L6U5M3_9FLAO|nr:hypothetical protein [Winogradskyella endarachnes]MUU77481.1 hypothetical protein [Winogradskyella endarachnes]
MSKVIGFNNAIFWTDDTDILYCDFSNDDPNLKLDIKNGKAYVDAILTLCDGNSKPFLIDLSKTCGSFTISIVKLLARNPKLTNVKVSESYLIDTMGIKLLIAYYKKLYDPNTTFGIFKDKTLAKKFCQNIDNCINSNMLKLAE